MTPLETIILNAALRELGAPYIWGGKGDVLWTPTGLAISPVLQEAGLPVHGFDCSGLWTWAFKEAGLGDTRGQHSAQTLFSKLPPVFSATQYEAHPVLVFYGQNENDITHIAGMVSIYGRPYCLESARGTHKTITVPIARQTKAGVRLSPNARSDFMGMRTFPTKAADL